MMSPFIKIGSQPQHVTPGPHVWGDLANKLTQGYQPNSDVFLGGVTIEN